MKVKLFLSAIAIFVASASFSQSFQIGAKAGASINKLSGQSFSDKFTFGYHVGGFATINLSKKIGIQPEVIFNQVNTDTSSSFSSVYQFNNVSKVKLNYLSIPILLNYNPSKLVTLQVGPQYSILMNQNVTLVQNGKNAFKNGDFAMVGGLQLNLMKLKIYGRYVVGLNNINDLGDQQSWKNQSIQLGIGLTL
ncbi:MAG: porin family protein [Ginsengibacter sp.]